MLKNIKGKRLIERENGNCNKWKANIILFRLDPAKWTQIFMGSGKIWLNRQDKESERCSLGNVVAASVLKINIVFISALIWAWFPGTILYWLELLSCLNRSIAPRIYCRKRLYVLNIDFLYYRALGNLFK